MAQAEQGGEMLRTRQPKEGLTTTRSPSFPPAARAEAPTSSTRPKISWPRTQGIDENGDSDGEYLSRMVDRSLPQNPVASTATLHHSGPRSAGSSTSRSCRHDGRP